MVNYKELVEPKYIDLFCTHVYSKMGIFIEEGKKGLFTQKLIKLFRESGLESMGEYYHAIVAPPISEGQRNMQAKFIDNVTVHKTNFFRENNHFEHIKATIGQIIKDSPTVKRTGELRVWSSACSTGEEPYTLGILLNEILPPHVRPKILATDISPQSLHTAIAGVYKFGPEDNIPPFYITKYFVKEGDSWKISDEIKKLVTFRMFNLVDMFPFKNPFDIIFCRNVMIYFDHDVQEKLVQNFYNALTPNGLLFIGHSESLIQIKHSFKFYEPTIYKKPK